MDLEDYSLTANAGRASKFVIPLPASISLTFCVLSGEVKIEIRLSTYRKNHVAYPFLLSTVGFILVILVSDFQPVIDGVVFRQPLPCLLRNPVQLGYI